MLQIALLTQIRTLTITIIIKIKFKGPRCFLGVSKEHIETKRPIK